MKTTGPLSNAELAKSVEHIRKLEQKHRALDHHWSGTHLDPRESDHLFKHHLMRLRHIYKHHISHDVTVQAHTAIEDRAKLHMSAVTRLYGKEGLLTSATSERDTLKEIGWDDDVHIPTQRDPVGSKVKLMMAQAKAKTGSVPQDSIDFNGSSQINSSIPDPFRKTLRKYRCVDPQITDEDVIVLGKYRLSEYQSNVYQEFVQMLKGMDPFDVNNILADINSDINEANSLEAYGGTEAHCLVSA